MRRLIGFLFIAVVALGSAAPGARAQDGDVRVNARVNQSRLVVGDSFIYEIRIDGARGAEVPSLGSIGGVDWQYLGGTDSSISTRMVINGNAREIVREAYIMQWEMTATREGTIRIPAQEVVVDGRAHKVGAVIARAGPALETGDMSLSVRTARDSVYVGEAVEAVITWRCFLTPRTVEFTNIGKDKDAVRWFDAPTNRNGDRVKIEVLGDQVEATQRVVRIGGQEAIEFEIRRYVVPQRSGEVRIGPLSVRSALIVRKARGFFDRDQTREAGAVSEMVTLDVKPLPEREDGGSGPVLVGRYALSSDVARTRVRMGDPIELTVRVTGAMAGRVATFDLESIPGFAEGFRVSDEVGRRELDDGSLELTYSIRVTSAEVTEIPSVELLCFDTKDERYRRVRSKAIPLEVEATRVVTADDGFGAGGMESGSGVSDASGGVVANYSGDVLMRRMGFSLADAARDPVWVGAAAAPPALFAGSLVFVGMRRARERRGGKKGAARRALVTARRAIQGAPDAEGIAAGVRAYMQGRFEIGGEATPDAISRVAPGDAGERLIGVLARCDAARFGGDDVGDTASMREAAIGALEALERAQKGGGS